METDQRRIEEDLRGLVQGDVRCDNVFTQLYATDASIYELRPLGVVRPRTTAGVRDGARATVIASPDIRLVLPWVEPAISA
jgi:FAD/FMN-containing dehydrogenase